MVKSMSRSTMPLIISRCAAGSTSATPPWWRSKHRPFGVTKPSSAYSGVKLTEDCVVAVSHSTLRRTTSLSNWLGMP